jgi:hypothetical protein
MEPNVVIFRVPSEIEGEALFAELPYKNGFVSENGVLFTVESGDTYNDLTFSHLVLAAKDEEDGSSYEIARILCGQGKTEVDVYDTPIEAITLIVRTALQQISDKPGAGHVIH